MSIEERIEERYSRVCEKICDMAVNEMRRQKDAMIAKAKSEMGYVEVSETKVVSGDSFEDPFESEDFETVEATTEATTKVEESSPPEPVATKPRPISHREKDGKVSKSKLIRDFFDRHPDASNKDLIVFYKEKHKIEIKPQLVSTVKASMGIPKSKRRGRPAKDRTHARVAVASAKRGLPMPACLTKVIAKSKQGLRINEILKGLKKLYTYSGKQDEDGLKNVAYQGLYALSKKKPHRGWKGDVPVILHDEESHTWRMNPKAERKTA